MKKKGSTAGANIAPATHDPHVVAESNNWSPDTGLNIVGLAFDRDGLYISTVSSDGEAGLVHETTWDEIRNARESPDICASLVGDVIRDASEAYIDESSPRLSAEQQKLKSFVVEAISAASADYFLRVIRLAAQPSKRNHRQPESAITRSWVAARLGFTVRLRQRVELHCERVLRFAEICGVVSPFEN